MGKNSETGYAINIENYGILIETCESFEVAYNPVNAAIFVANMKVQHEAVKTLESAYLTAISKIGMPRNKRAVLFEKLVSVAKRSVGVLESSDATKGEIRNAKGFVRLITGSNVKKKKEVRKETDGEERSNSHLSFVSKRANFVQLRNLYLNSDFYVANEADLTTDSMQDLVDAIDDVNLKVGKAMADARVARRARCEAFNAEGTGVIDVSIKCKKYVTGVFGARSPEGRSVTGIKIRRFKS